MSLKCSTGYTLTGDTTVTCKEGRMFTFKNAPVCQLGSNFKTANFKKLDYFPATISDVICKVHGTQGDTMSE